MLQKSSVYEMIKYRKVHTLVRIVDKRFTIMSDKTCLKILEAY